MCKVGPALKNTKMKSAGEWKVTVSRIPVIGIRWNFQNAVPNLSQNYYNIVQIYVCYDGPG